MLRVVYMIFGAVVLGLSLQPAAAAGQESVQAAACTESATAGKNGAPVFSGSAFMIVATSIENQGKGNIRPAYDEPKSVCDAGTFQSGGFHVKASYAGFEPGMQTLLYRFSAEKEGESREVLVLYSGTLSFVQNSGPHFYMSETRAARTSFYAMYNNEPGYDVLKIWVGNILSGSVGPLVAVEWPADSKELMIVEFDSERLN